MFSVLFNRKKYRNSNLKTKCLQIDLKILQLENIAISDFKNNEVIFSLLYIHAYRFNGLLIFAILSVRINYLKK